MKVIQVIHSFIHTYMNAYICSTDIFWGCSLFWVYWKMPLYFGHAAYLSRSPGIFQGWEINQTLKCGQVRLVCNYIFGEKESPVILLFKNLKISKSVIISQRKQLCTEDFIPIGMGQASEFFTICHETYLKGAGMQGWAFFASVWTSPQLFTWVPILFPWIFSASTPWYRSKGKGWYGLRSGI